MAATDELAYLSVAELSRRIRRRELSALEVLDAFIARIEARNPSLNAFVFTDFEGARAAARAADQALASRQQVGPLHGIPVAIKDLFDFKPGWPATFGGIPALRHHVIDAYCLFAERIERAGAIIVGKTNSPVMGFRGTCDNPLFGPTRNPFDLARNSGGSSGGSAAAVADGLIPFAEGTDGGGSIRIPASWCGVYGYKASFGRVPAVGYPNAFGLTAPFIAEGPITRHVADAALALNVLSGYDPRDPFSLDERIDFTAALDRPISVWKIAYSADFGVFPVDPRVAETARGAVQAFAEAGAHVDEVAIGLDRSHRELAELWCRLIMPLNLEALSGLKERGFDLLRDAPDDLPPEYRHWLDVGQRLSASDFYRDQTLRSEVWRAVQAVFASHDLLVTPTLACLPVENAADRNTIGPAEVNGQPVERLIGWSLTYPLNFTGHPAASIPAGLADGLPVGLQIVGRRYADADVLAASAAFERLRPWQESYRACMGRQV